MLCFGVFVSVVSIAQPSITSFSPNKGPVGTLVTITGNNLENTSNITIGDATAVPVTISRTKLVALVMPGAVTGDVVITSPNGTANGTSIFTITPAIIPNGQQGNKINSTSSLDNYEGTSVAISADGNTIAVGGIGKGSSASSVWIHTRKDGIWSKNGIAVRGSFANNLSGFGKKIALNADGSTLLVGGNSGVYSTPAIAAWVFTRNGDTWSQQGPRLVVSDIIAESSTSTSAVSLSADGNTAIIGGGDNTGNGAVWVFVRNGSTWTQQGPKLSGLGSSPGGPGFGASVSLNADGNTALIGGPNDNGGIGACWVFIRKNGKWSQQGNKLVGDGFTGKSNLGASVSISADGNTALIGSPGNNSVCIFTRKGNFWSQQSAKLTGTGGVGILSARQGTAVSLSADGNLAIVGGQKDNFVTTLSNAEGAAWIFMRKGNTWTQLGEKLIGTGAIGGAEQGNSVAMSADGETAIVGGWLDDKSEGATWVYSFIPPPVISSFSPDAASKKDTVIINGSNFSNISEVSFGGTAAASFKILSPTYIQAIVDSGTTGEIKITSPVGSSSLSGFSFIPIVQPTIELFTPASASRFDTLTIKGTNFKWVTAVSLGGTSVASFKVLSSTMITAVVGTGSSGFVQLTAVGGAAALSGFSLIPLPQPTIDSFTPVSAERGDTITIKGNNFKWVTGVSLGGTSVASFKILSPTTITAVVGTGTSGFVRLTSVGGSASLSGFSFVATFPPSITSFTPTSAQEGNTVMIYGNNFKKIQNISFGGISATTFTVLSSTAIISTLGEGASGNLRITASGGTVSVSGFTFIIPPPIINSFSPKTGKSGDSVLITGTNFKTVSAITLGGATAASFRILSPTSLIAKVGAGNTGLIKVTSPGGSDSIPGFTYIPLPPSITSFSGTSGPVGTLVTIKGNNLLSPKSILIGGVPAIPISNNGSTLVAMVMPGATTDIISLITAGGSVNSANKFTVIPTNAPNKNGQQGDKLIGSDVKGNAQQGFSVSLSADGNTAIVGAPQDDAASGAAFIFQRIDSIWTQQGPKLIGSDVTGTGQSNQGYSVSISADGNTAIIGGLKDKFNLGAAWIFTRKGSTWVQQGPKLVGTGSVGGSIFQGTSVCLSADGNTAIIGGYGDNFNTGAAWVFIRNGERWIQQGNKISGTGALGAAYQGSSVSLSADGNTAIIGGEMDNSGLGASWIFTRTEGIWTQQGSKIVGSNAINTSYQGSSVNLSADGNTAIIGGYGDSSNCGAAWVFSRKNDKWYQQGKKLVGSTPERNAYQGISVSLSADGNTALIGGNGANYNSGAAWIFNRTDSIWLEKDKLLGSGAKGASQQGNGVSLSADGGTAIIGGILDNTNVGASWVFSFRPPPVIDGFLPTTARAGDTITITGSNFNKVSAVSLGGMSAASFRFISSNKLIAVVGKGASGAVSVTSIYGTAALTGFVFTVDPPSITSFSSNSGPIGSLVTINGSNLLNPISISIGGAAAIPVSTDKNTIVAMVMPGASSGEISVTTAGGTANANGNFIVTPSKIPRGQQGEKLTGAGISEYANFGYSIAISADGNTAVVGSHTDNNYSGSAHIFTRSGTSWTQQGIKLVGSDAIGNAWQGKSVAINADGNTVLIGGPLDNDGRGAVWVFRRKNGIWYQHGSKLVGTGVTENIYTRIRANQGWSVALSADGETALVAGTIDYYGAWIFKLESDNWLQQGEKLVPANISSGSGFSIALSSDGKTAILGSSGAKPYYFSGAAWIFSNNQGNWKQEAELAGLESSGPNIPKEGSSQGTSVAISADGNTAILGANSAENNKGAAWIFTRKNKTWDSFSEKIMSNDNAGLSQMGISVSLSADGKIAMIGGQGDNNGFGAAWYFTLQGKSWKQEGSKIFGIGNVLNANQGISSSLSSDGNTAIIGGNFDDNQGALWVFSEANFPVITSFSPTRASEGDTVTINGRYLSGTNLLTFGGTSAATFNVLSSTTILAVVGSGSSGAISLTTQGGSTSLSGFTFLPAQAEIASFHPKSGPVGSLVYIKGKKLSILQKITIGKTEAIPVNISDTLLVAMVMPGAVTGIIGITTTTNGYSNSRDSFTVRPAKIPNKQQGAKLVGTGTVSGYFGISYQGSSISLSADGNTAIVGGPIDNSYRGAAWIFTRDGGTWKQQGTKLVGRDNSGNASMGTSVAISADGNTAIVGGPTDNSNVGAAWIFNRINNKWYQEGPKLVGTGAQNVSSAGAHQAGSVSLSADGNTAAMGGYLDNDKAGAVWIFKRSEGIWYQQGSKLVATDAVGKASFGLRVQLSANGNYLVVGGISDSFNVGASWIFTKKGNNWIQQGPKLVGTGRQAHQYVSQGMSVAINADGSTAIIGGIQDNNSAGASWIFTRNGETWTQQGSKLVGTGSEKGPAEQGMGVSISADGNTAIIGGQGDNNRMGASWLFQRIDGKWVQFGNKLVGTGSSGNSYQGRSVSISADGQTAFVGGITDSISVGASWVYANIPPTPLITSFSPTITKMKDTVTIIGSNFSNITSILFGGISIANFEVFGDTLIKAIVENVASGEVSVNTTGGTAALSGFIYLNAPLLTTFSPTTAPAGYTITISGKYLSNVSSISLGGTSVTSFSIISDSSISAVVGNGSTGRLRVINSGGSANLAGFTFVPPTSLVSFSPTKIGKGNIMSIIGKGLQNVTQVKLGGNSVSSFTIVSDTLIQAVVGNGKSGFVSIITDFFKDSLPGFVFGEPTIVIIPPDTTLQFGTSVGVVTPVQSYQICANYLQDKLTIAAPYFFEISLSPNSGFQPMIQIDHVLGKIDTTTIYVRFISDSAGYYSAPLLHTSDFATNKSFTVIGNSQCDSFINFTPVINNFINDSVICFKDSLILSPSNGNFAVYKWNTGDTTRKLVINKSGDFSLQIGNGNACYSNISKTIRATKNTNPIPSIALLSNKTLLSSSAPKYRWYVNNLLIPGNNTNTYMPDKIGMYAVETSIDGICWDRSMDFPILTLTPTPNSDSVLIKTYPNPSSTGLFYVVVTLPDPTNMEVRVTVADANGIVLLQTNKFIFFGVEIKIPISLTYKGTVFVKIEVNGNVYSKTVILQ